MLTIQNTPEIRLFEFVIGGPIEQEEYEFVAAHFALLCEQSRCPRLLVELRAGGGMNPLDLRDVLTAILGAVGRIERTAVIAPSEWCKEASPLFPKKIFGEIRIWAANQKTKACAWIRDRTNRQSAPARGACR